MCAHRNQQEKACCRLANFISVQPLYDGDGGVLIQLLVLDHDLDRVVVFSSLTDNSSQLRVIRRLGDAIAGPGAAAAAVELDGPQVCMKICVACVHSQIVCFDFVFSKMSISRGMCCVLFFIIAGFNLIGRWRRHGSAGGSGGGHRTSSARVVSSR
jgi:hypothetical protein